MLQSTNSNSTQKNYLYQMVNASGQDAVSASNSKNSGQSQSALYAEFNSLMEKITEQLAVSEQNFEQKQEVKAENEKVVNEPKREEKLVTSKEQKTDEIETKEEITLSQEQHRNKEVKKVDQKSEENNEVEVAKTEETVIDQDSEIVDVETIILTSGEVVLKDSAKQASEAGAESSELFNDSDKDQEEQLEFIEDIEIATEEVVTENTDTIDTVTNQLQSDEQEVVEIVDQNSEMTPEVETVANEAVSDQVEEQEIEVVDTTEEQTVVNSQASTDEMLITDAKDNSETTQQESNTSSDKLLQELVKYAKNSELAMDKNMSSVDSNYAVLQWQMTQQGVSAEGKSFLTNNLQVVGASETQAAVKAEMNSELKGEMKSNMMRNFEKVEDALKEVIRSKDGKSISVRLDPPQLGQVKVDVTFREGQLTARFIAESPQVASMLKDKSPEMQAVLKKMGFDFNEVTVLVADNTLSNSTDMSDLGSKRGDVNQGKNDNNEYQILNDLNEEVIATSNSEVTQVEVTDHWVA